MAPARAGRPTARLLAAAALLLALALAFSAAARAGVTGTHGAAASRRAAKTGHHARHGARRARPHHARRHAAAKPRRIARRTPAPAVELIPAACEDGTLPSHSGGGAYSCEDGSAPSCEDGSLRTPASGAPMCAVLPSGEEGCSGEAGACGGDVEFNCEDPSAPEASADCERSEEAEGSEAEE